MEPLEFVDRLAEVARGAPPVKTDVKGAVLARLRRREQSWPITPLLIFAGWMVPVAAASVLVVAMSWAKLKPTLTEAASSGPFDDLIGTVLQ
jgi:hypothetical protein